MVSVAGNFATIGILGSSIPTCFCRLGIVWVYAIQKSVRSSLWFFHSANKYRHTWTHTHIHYHLITTRVLKQKGIEIVINNIYFWWYQEFKVKSLTKRREISFNDIENAHKQLLLISWIYVKITQKSHWLSERTNERTSEHKLYVSMFQMNSICVQIVLLTYWKSVMGQQNVVIWKWRWVGDFWWNATRHTKRNPDRGNKIFRFAQTLLNNWWHLPNRQYSQTII